MQGMEQLREMVLMGPDPSRGRWPWVQRDGSVTWGSFVAVAAAIAVVPGRLAGNWRAPGAETCRRMAKPHDRRVRSVRRAGRCARVAEHVP